MDDIKIRHGFIRKVYSILSLQLLITVCLVLLVISIKELRNYFIQNTWLMYLLVAGTFIIMLVLACFGRNYPINLILLLIFTIMKSLLIGYISSIYDTHTILIALGITVSIVICITIFAFQTKIDFTGFGIYLFLLTLLFLVVSIFAIIFRNKIMQVVYAGLGAGLFSFYLIFDTQLMIGGNHVDNISPEDYVLAALNLYVDIINLFLKILK